MMALKYKSESVPAWRFWLGMVLVVVCMVAMSMFWSGEADAGTTPASTTATTACYPDDGDPTGEHCDETRTDDGAVEWNAYDQTPKSKCAGYIITGAVVGGGTGGLGGAAWGAGGGVATCWINTW